MQRILIVDDMEVNREILREILQGDYIVEVADNGQEAMKKLLEYQDDTIALLLDLQMPKMDGYAVIQDMKEAGLIKRIPVLIISSEDSVEIETKCLEQGALDFIHKPFEPSVVKNRIKNTVDLFTYKNQLEQKLKEQTIKVKTQNHIIEMQAHQLMNAKNFDNLMTHYRSAMMEVETKLKVLDMEFSQVYNRNPFEAIKSRLKSVESIYEKLRRKGFPITVKSIEENLSDVAGVRVICSFPDDIYRLADLITNQDDYILICKKDYIKNPKPNGYRSLHLLLDVPIYLSNGMKYVRVELQFRTIAMDFWASLEHKLKYKKNVENTEKIVQQLKECADSIELLDYQMQKIRNKIDKSRE